MGQRWTVHFVSGVALSSFVPYWGPSYRRDKLLAGINCSRANSKKKATSHNFRKWPPYGVRPHDGFCSLLRQKSCYKKFYRTEIRARTPRAIWLKAVAQRSAVALRFGCWRASFLFWGLDVRALGVGGMLQSSITISSARRLFPLSLIIFEYFLNP